MPPEKNGNNTRTHTHIHLTQIAVRARFGSSAQVRRLLITNMNILLRHAQICTLCTDTHKYEHFARIYTNMDNVHGYTQM